MDDDTRHALVGLLREYQDIFTSKLEEVPGNSLAVIEHRLNVDLAHKPMVQKKRHIGPERAVVATVEVKKLLAVGFIREFQYSEWISIVVLVKKPNGSWWMYFDFTDLNKACLKDSYLLPKINKLVDGTASYAMLSFIDAFSGYH